MRSAILTGLLFLTTAFSVASQTTTTTTKPDTSTTTTTSTTATTTPPDQYVRPDGSTRFKRYLSSMFGPTALAKRVVSAGYSTWRNSPEEWGPHWEGFGKRFASGTGKSIIKNSVQFGLDEAFKLDSHYYRSKNKSVGSRIKNALISPVTARNESGKRVFGFPRIIGTYTGSIVAAETWYPDRYTWKNGVRSGTISLGMNAAFNLVKEFIWKK